MILEARRFQKSASLRPRYANGLVLRRARVRNVPRRRRAFFACMKSLPTSLTAFHHIGERDISTLWASGIPDRGQGPVPLDLSGCVFGRLQFATSTYGRLPEPVWLGSPAPGASVIEQPRAGCSPDLASGIIICCAAAPPASLNRFNC